MNKSFSYGAFLMVYLMALLITAGYAFLGGSLQGIHVAYRLEFMLLTMVIYLIDFWLLTHTFALFIGYGTNTAKVKNKTTRNTRSMKQGSYISVQVPFIITHMIVLVFYIVLLTVMLPAVHQRIMSIRAVSTTLKNFVSQAQENISIGNNDAAIMYLEEYNTYIDADEGVAALLNTAYTNRSNKPPPIPALPSSITSYDGYSLKELIQLSEEHLAKEDYISANYYANQAQRLSKDSRFDVEQLLQRSQEGIKDVTRQTFSERKDWDRYTRTVDGYQDYINGLNGNVAALVRAYFTFTDLLAEYPADPDIKLYYKRSREQVEQFSFSEQELDLAKSFPAMHNSVFLNRSGSDYHELVYIDVVYSMENNYYATGVEVIRFDNAGGIQEHVLAPAAKSTGPSLNFRMVEYDRSISPVQIIKGEQRNEELLYLMPLAAPIQELLTSSKPQQLIRSTDTIALLRLVDSVKDRAPELWSMSLEELSKRILKGVGILFFSLFFTTMSIRLCKQNETGTGLGKGIIFLPIIIIILYFLQETYLYIGSILLASTAMVLGNGVAIVQLIVMISVLLLYTLIRFYTETTPLHD